jgi:hypothetical protein
MLIKRFFARALFGIGMWCVRKAGGGQQLNSRIFIANLDWSAKVDDRPGSLSWRSKHRFGREHGL